MRAIKSKNSRPEIQIRKALFASGLRYRIHFRDLPGSPDIVFTRIRVAIDVRGCFWHAHNCRVANTPKSNIDYWASKLARNVERDRENERALKDLGWQCLVVWECQLRRQSFVKALVGRIKSQAANRT